MSPRHRTVAPGVHWIRMNTRKGANMKIRSAVLVLLALFLSALGPSALPARDKLEPVIEIDLLRLEEAYRLIDTFGETIWPDWKNDMEVEFQLQYPNLVFVTVALRDAYLEKDDARALVLLKDYCAARELKRARMPPESAAY
jgi:hypothetical protein